MAVPYFKRSVNKKEYEYHFKQKVYKPLIDLLKCDFNIDFDKANAMEDNPKWLIDDKRTELLKSASIIFTYISRAKFYPTTEKQWNMKLTYQSRAIQETSVLHDNIQVCSEIFKPIKNINVYIQLAQAVKDEMIYLKYWSKYTEKIECPNKENAVGVDNEEDQ